MEVEDIIKVMRELDKITEAEFIKTINTHYKDINYSTKVWQEFRRHRFGFTVSREPPEPGHDVIRLAIKKAGV